MVLISILISGCTMVDKPSPVLKTPNYLITNVNLIDVISGEVLKDHQVEVQNGKIIGIAPVKRNIKNTTYAGQFIDAKGGYLVPGFWDSHVVLNQLSPELDYPLYIGHGVTSVRSILNCPNPNEVSLYPCMKQKYDWNQSVVKAELVGPEIKGSGTFPINGKGEGHPDSPDFYRARTKQEIDKIIQSFSVNSNELKPFFLKNYNWLEPENYLYLVKQAKEMGFEVGGHMSRKVGLNGAVLAGQRSFAHARLFLFDCSKWEAELRNGQHWDKPLPELYLGLLENFDETGCQQKYQLMAEREVYLSPTLLTRRNDYLAVSGKREVAEGAEYVHYMFDREWQEDQESLLALIQSEEDAELFNQFYLKAADTIAQAQKAGVTILAGTDSYDIYVVPGVSLHEEMALLNEAGISELDVLRAATINAAKYFRLEKEVGSLQVGKIADMVLLESNPLENIRHTRDIRMVFQQDRVYSQKKLVELKQGVKTLAQSHGVTARLISLFLQNPVGF